MFDEGAWVMMMREGERFEHEGEDSDASDPTGARKWLRLVGLGRQEKKVGIGHGRGEEAVGAVMSP